jgi:hypothetical protein
MPSSPVVLVGRGGVVVILRMSFPEAFLTDINTIEEEKERRRPLYTSYPFLNIDSNGVVGEERSHRVVVLFLDSILKSST